MFTRACNTRHTTTHHKDHAGKDMGRRKQGKLTPDSRRDDLKEMTQEDARRHGDVERVHEVALALLGAEAGAADDRRVRAGALHHGAQAAALAAHDDDGGRRAGRHLGQRLAVRRDVGGHHAPAVGGGVVEHDGHVAHGVHGHDLERAGGSLAHDGREPRRVLLGDDDAGGAEEVGAAQHGAEVLRVRHLVQRKPDVRGRRSLRQLLERLSVELLAREHQALMRPVRAEVVEHALVHLLNLEPRFPR
mmetsp:Transcript_33789/g.106740  ORF Transcript_33789/g.106740 Transcript_33789/m.106740 type:complete len:247 (-) Transcript_33789:246-986(-)